MLYIIISADFENPYQFSWQSLSEIVVTLVSVSAIAASSRIEMLKKCLLDCPSSKGNQAPHPKFERPNRKNTKSKFSGFSGFWTFSYFLQILIYFFEIKVYSAHKVGLKYLSLVNCFTSKA